MNLKNSLNFLFIFLALMFTTNFLQSTLLETFFFQVQIIYILFTLFFLLYYIINCLINHETNRIIFFLIFLIFFVPIYSAFRSQIVFSQPFIYGVLSLRSWLLCITGIWFYYNITKGYININLLKNSFVFMAWVSLILFSIYNFIGHQNPDSSFINSTGLNDSFRGIRFIFERYFITFGVLYYFLKSNNEQKLKNFIFAGIFIFFILTVVQRRTDILFTILTFLSYYFIDVPNKSKIIKFFKFFIFSISCIFFIQFLNPKYFLTMTDLFYQMIEVVSGVESSDASANARIFTSYLVFDYWSLNPETMWIGAGKISNQWNEGFASVFGYFYPKDIGFLGGIFLFGIIPSFIIVVIPFIISYRLQGKINNNDNLFILTIKYFLIYKMFGFIQGTYFFNPQEYILLILILLAYIDYKNNFLLKNE